MKKRQREATHAGDRGKPRQRFVYVVKYFIELCTVSLGEFRILKFDSCTNRIRSINLLPNPNPNLEIEIRFVSESKFDQNSIVFGTNSAKFGPISVKCPY